MTFFTEGFEEFWFAIRMNCLDCLFFPTTVSLSRLVLSLLLVPSAASPLLLSLEMRSLSRSSSTAWRCRENKRERVEKRENNGGKKNKRTKNCAFLCCCCCCCCCYCCYCCCVDVIIVHTVGKNQSNDGVSIIMEPPWWDMNPPHIRQAVTLIINIIRMD